jgi:hypothetical protein
MEHMANDDSDLIITPSDLLTVATGMLPHCKIINPEHGKKSLLDLGAEEHDPLTFAWDIMIQKFGEGIFKMLANPKQLEKIILKKMGKKGRYGDNFSDN